MSQFLFLSTLSLRRATLLIKPLYQILIISIHALLAESDDIMRGADSKDRISIHALLAESDGTGADRGWPVPHFYPRSPCGERRLAHDTYVIMEAFLSTLSLRRATKKGSGKSTTLTNFYPRSPCGERPLAGRTIAGAALFLSTLSLRRATHFHNCQN